MLSMERRTIEQMVAQNLFVITWQLYRFYIVRFAGFSQSLNSSNNNNINENKMKVKTIKKENKNLKRLLNFMDTWVSYDRLTTKM